MSDPTTNEVTKLLRIPLTSLKVVRVISESCKRGVIEVPVSRLGAAVKRGVCNFCPHEFYKEPDGDPLEELQDAIEKVADLMKNKKLRIEFEVPTPE